MFSGTLEELGHVADDCSEHELVLVAVEPAELGDAGEEGDQALDDELGELGLGPEIVEDIIPDVHPALELEDGRGSADQLGDGRGGQQLGVRGTATL